MMMPRQRGTFACKDRANIPVRAFIARCGGCKRLGLASALDCTLQGVIDSIHPVMQILF